MGRLEQPVADGPLREFAEDLRALRRTTAMTYRALARRAGYSYSVLSAAASGANLPTLAVTLAYVGACGGDQAAWEARWNELAALLRATQPGLLPPDDAGAAQLEPDAEPVMRATRPSTAGQETGPQVEPLDKQDPRRIGPFRVLGRLGGGAMGQVYLASSPAGRPVAVKLVLPQLARDPLFRRRFARELAAARTVRGGHSPAVLDADADAERPWMATAYIPGPSLGDVVEAHGPLPDPVVLGLAAGVAEALADFHAAGVVHRDLKPSNVLLAHDGPMVIDFGISRALEGTSLTATGAQVGTAGYMAPEQAEGREITPAADVFALGCLLAYAATGIAPFGEGPSASVLYRIVHEEPNKDALACQDKQLRALIERCLDKDPGRRSTPAQIIEHCSRGPRAGEGWLPAALAAQIARRSAHAATLIGRAARRRTIQRAQIGLAPLLLILAIVLTAVLLGRGNTPNLTTAPPPSTAPGPLDTGATPGGGGSPGGAQAQGVTGGSTAVGVGGVGANAGGGSGGAATSAAGGNAGGITATSAAPAQGFTSTYKYSFEVGTENWGRSANSDVTLARSGTYAKDGSFSLAMTDTAAQSTAYVGVVKSGLSDGPAPGATVTAWIYVPAGGGQIKAHLYTQDGGGWRNGTDITVSPGSGWQLLTFTVPGDAGTATSVGVQFAKAGASTTVAYLDAVTWR